MRRTLALFAGAVLALAIHDDTSAQNAAGGPRWTLDMNPVQTGTVTANGVQGPGGYLYMIFEIKNASGVDGVKARLGIDVETDVAGRSYRGGFDPVVHAMLEKKMGRKFKRMSQSRTALDDGDKIEVLAVFGKVDPNVDTFQFVVDGLKDRVYVDKYQTWVQDDLRLFTYGRPGDEFYRQHDLLKAEKFARWITREERKKLTRKPIGG